jgi:hypothetical protein
MPRDANAENITNDHCVIADLCMRLTVGLSLHTRPVRCCTVIIERFVESMAVPVTVLISLSYLTSRRKFLWNNSLSLTVYSNLPIDLAIETPGRTVKGGDHVFLLFYRVYWAKPATLGVCSTSHVFSRTATPNPKGVSELYAPSK